MQKDFLAYAWHTHLNSAAGWMCAMTWTPSNLVFLHCVYAVYLAFNVVKAVELFKEWWEYDT